MCGQRCGLLGEPTSCSIGSRRNHQCYLRPLLNHSYMKYFTRLANTLRLPMVAGLLALSVAAQAQCTTWINPAPDGGWADFNTEFGGAPCDDGTVARSTKSMGSKYGPTRPMPWTTLRSAEHTPSARAMAWEVLLGHCPSPSSLLAALWMHSVWMWVPFANSPGQRARPVPT
jgi:hypothetical protein